MAGVLAAAALSAACGPAGDSDAKKRIAPVYDPQTGKLTELKYDSNGDGQADTWSYMDGSRVLRIEIDKNQDGRIERWEYYGTDGQTTARLCGSASRDPIRAPSIGSNSTNTEHWCARRTTRTATAGWTSGKTYEGSRLVSVAFDSTFRGSPDRRLLYGADGTVRLEVDPGGKGHFVPRLGSGHT